VAPAAQLTIDSSKWLRKAVGRPYVDQDVENGAK
jgi:hypothetical protein